MEDRPFRQTTGWSPASVVIDMPDVATELHFGALLDGAGAVDLTRPWFGEADQDIPVTAVPIRSAPLPDQPQGLDFAAGAP